MSMAYYAREIAYGGAPIKDATPYRTVDEALAEILQHMRGGGVIKGWVEDQDGHVVMLPEAVSAALNRL